MADPSVHVFNGKIYIYPSHDYYSGIPEDDWGIHFDMKDYHVLSITGDPMTGEVKDEGVVLTREQIPWAKKQLWDCDVQEKDGKYYMYFPAKDKTGIFRCGVAISDKPEGPFIPEPHPIEGSYSIDYAIFKDDDGTYYMYYGGWRHCNMVKLGDDLTSVVPFDDGTVYKEVTPKGYVEGPFMLKRKGKYYFMWSEGGWTGPDYHVAYAIADSPFGPFERIGTILESDPDVATGAGHHSVIKGKGQDEYYIIYHRHPLSSSDGNHRVVCIERLRFDADGKILPVKITFDGVPASKL